MRFILRYKYGILQTKTERIDIEPCEDTTHLLLFLEKRVRQPRSNFILKTKQGRNQLRILNGWPLHHYGLHEGCELTIEEVEVPKADEKRNSHIHNKYINNVLGFSHNALSSMEVVPEEPQEDQHGDFNVRKYLDQECEKMLKEIQRNNIQGFRDIFQELPVDVPD